MALLMRRRILLAKIESTYGTDPIPTGAANAMAVRALNVTPLDGQLIGRDLIRPYLGSSEQIQVETFARLESEVELAGSGAAGAAPKWGPMLRACGFLERILATAHSGTAQAGSATTITLAAAASATDNAYKGMVIDLTGGAGSGQSAMIVSYVGSTKVATLQRTLSPAPNATTTYEIDAQVSYAPLTPAGGAFESVTEYFNIDGVLHKMLGARGTVKLSLTAQALPVMMFTMTGLYSPVTDVALPTADYTGFQIPVAVNTTNTTGLILHGLAGSILQELEMDIDNSVVHRQLVGSDSVIITDRAAKGSVKIEAVPIATKDYFTAAQTTALGSLQVTHGPANNQVWIGSPRMQVIQPTYEDSDGIAMLAFNTMFIPSTGSGDDEILIAVK